MASKPPTSDEKQQDLESNYDEIVDNFDNMALQENLLRGIYAYGFEKPSSIQQRAIVPLTKGRDVLAQAQSGTGKTATFFYWYSPTIGRYFDGMPRTHFGSNP